MTDGNFSKTFLSTKFYHKVLNVFTQTGKQETGFRFRVGKGGNWDLRFTILE